MTLVPFKDCYSSFYKERRPAAQNQAVGDEVSGGDDDGALAQRKAEAAPVEGHGDSSTIAGCNRREVGVLEPPVRLWETSKKTMRMKCDQTSSCYRQ